MKCDWSNRYSHGTIIKFYLYFGVLCKFHWTSEVYATLRPSKLFRISARPAASTVIIAFQATTFNGCSAADLPTARKSYLGGSPGNMHIVQLRSVSLCSSLFSIAKFCFVFFFVWTRQHNNKAVQHFGRETHLSI